LHPLNSSNEVFASGCLFVNLGEGKRTVFQVTDF
jgi:hypothetical protein